MKNKYAICEWVMPVTGPFALKLAGEMGYHGIQLGDLGGAEMDYPLCKPRIQSGYLQAAQESGVEIQAVHLHSLVRDGTMIQPINSAEGKRAKLSIEKGVEACSAMGVNKLMLSAFFATSIRNDVEFKNYADHMKYAVNYGREYGVSIMFESVLLVDRIIQMRKIVGEEMKICYDTLNPIRWGSGDPSEEICRLGIDAIDHIHVKDMPDNMIGCWPLGEGSARFAETAKTLNSIGFKGWYVTENYYSVAPMPVISNDPLELARKDLTTMKRVFLQK